MNFRKFNKNSNDEKKIDSKGTESKGFRKLLDKEGFYIIMFLCVCIIGTVAVWVAKTNVDRIAEDNPYYNDKMGIEQSEIIDIAEKEIEDQTNDVIVIDEASETYEQPVIQDQNVTEDIIDEKNDSSEKLEKKNGKILVEDSAPQLEVATADTSDYSKEIAEPSTSEAIVMTWPTQGELGMGYAVETLTYSKTLEHFTTHHGIDVLAEMNTPVKAALAGDVIEVLTDSRLGITITIDHGDGLVTRYSNLCTDLMVNIGDSVTQGQTISGVGTSSIFESAEGPHLHFEVLLNGENVDPMQYLAEQ